MKNLMILLILVLTTQNSFAESSRYKSRSEKNNGRRYERNNDYSNDGVDRYRSKSKSERKVFNNNLNEYNSYSPKEKQKAQEKWQNFKKETTPEERKYIREKMRKERRR